MRQHRSARRGEIWLADLRPPRGDMLRGPHPVVVVSSDRTNRRSGLLMVVPLTSSSRRPMACHVPIAGFGLDRASTALAEQLTTVPAEWLLRPLGSLLGSREMGALEAAIKAQLEVA